MHKVSVLMPVYNDERYLGEALSSVLEQKGVEVELIVVDDGSTDGTPKIIDRYYTPKMIYVRHTENKGQLEALLTASQYITGDYVALLHGDDKITDEYALRDYAQILSHRKDIDGLYSDLFVIYSRTGVVRRLHVVRTVNKRTLIRLLSFAGSNPICDPFFVRKEYFFRSVIDNYVKWNMPYWFSVKDGVVDVGKVVYTKRPWYVYRISGENYVRSEIGRFVAANGVIRTVVTLSMFISLPRLSFLPFIPERFRRRLRTYLSRFRETSPEDPHFRGQVSSLLQIIGKAYKLSSDDSYYRALCSFYTKLQDGHKRKIFLTRVIQEPLYYGKDVNVFYKQLRNAQLPAIYDHLIKEAQNGYFEVTATKENVDSVRQILKFLNLSTIVHIHE